MGGIVTAFGKQAMAASMIGAVVAAIAAVAVGTRLPLSEEGRHAVTHLGPGVPALLLGVTTRRVWPRPRPERGTRIARSVLVAGLVIFGVGQVIEAVGAFGVQRVRADQRACGASRRRRLRRSTRCARFACGGGALSVHRGRHSARQAPLGRCRARRRGGSGRSVCHRRDRVRLLRGRAPQPRSCRRTVEGGARC